MPIRFTQMPFFKQFNPFRKPTARVIIQANLEEYERQLVNQEAAAAYHTKMAEYYREGIKRLQSQSHH